MKMQISVSESVSILFVSSLTLLLAPKSQASVLFQLSAPGVQQSAFQGTSSYLTETFDSVGSFGSSGTVGVGTYTATGTMTTVPASVYGGADGTGRYAFTNATGEFTVNLNTPSKYFGMWFSCTNPSNYVDVYSEGTLLATFDTQSLTNILGAKESPNSVLASDGNTYSGAQWYGNPNPGLNNSDVGRFQYAYINMGVSDPDATFDKLVIRGGYFEFDNMTTSSASFAQVVPEPSGCVLGVLGLAGILLRRRR
jgi:MYXO-CTERM domain-containing protein